MEPWEALDVDDSDLPFLLRPCKRLRRRETSILGSQTLEHEPEPSQPPPSPRLPPSPPSPQQQQRRRENFLSDSRSIPRSIPGPAGTVQLAMRQKTRDREHRDDVNPICTQEYIKRAVKHDAEFDEDFTRDPWLSALKYMGTVRGVVQAIPLKNIKGGLSFGKIDRVVAVIGSCSQNNRGGLMVTLKDPTGVIGAYIHHKVLTESIFAKCLHVGSVLILEKVSVFSPSKSVCYLNITLRNVVKVITKDSTCISEQDASTSVILGEACSQRAGSLEKTCSLNRGIREDLLEQCTNKRVELQENTGNCVDLEEECTSMRGSVQADAGICEDEQYTTKKGSLQANASICKDIPTQYTNRRGVSLANTVFNEDLQEQISNRRESLRPDEEPFVQMSDVSQGLSETMVKNKTHDYEQGFSQGKFAEEEGVGYSNDKLRNEENIEENTGQSQRGLVISSASLPQWTDEQLAELFAGEDMDDMI